MKHISLALLALTLTTQVAYADSNKEAAASISGTWNSAATHHSYTINKKGIVGRNAAACDGRYEQTFSIDKGDKWLVDAEGLAKDKMIPKSQYDALAKEIDRTKTYPQLHSGCGESNDHFILTNAETMVSMSCAEGNCQVIRHVRAH